MGMIIQERINATERTIAMGYFLKASLLELLLFLVCGCAGNGGVPDPYRPGEETPQEIMESEPILFGVESNGSRTYYDPSVNLDNLPELGYRICWEPAEDNVVIYCDRSLKDDGALGKSAVYTATAVAGNHSAYTAGLSLTELGESWTDYPVYKILDGNNTSLHWSVYPDGKEIPEHEFFGMYPAENLVAHPGMAEDGYTCTLIYNKSQKVACRINDSPGEKYKCRPDMKLAYMLARKSVLDRSNRLLLDFFPIMTTLHLRLKITDRTAGDSDSDNHKAVISGVSVILPQGIESEHLNFRFTNYDAGDSRRYKVATAGELGEIIDYGDFREPVFAGLYNESTGEPALTLAKGEGVDCFVFIPPLPRLTVDNIRIKVHVAGTHDCIISLSGNSGAVYTGIDGVSLKPSSRIEVILPPVDPSVKVAKSWMTPLDPSTRLRNLSIPGLECAPLVDKGLSPEELKNEIVYNLDAGVRCLDIREICDRAMTDDAREVSEQIRYVFESVECFFDDSRKVGESEILCLLTRNAADSQLLIDCISQNTELWESLLIDHRSVDEMRSSTLSELAARGRCLIIDEYADPHSGRPGYSMLNPDASVSCDLSGCIAAPVDFDIDNPIFNSGEVIRLVNGNIPETEFEHAYRSITDSQFSYGSTGIVMLTSPYSSDNDGTRSRMDLLIQGIIDCNYRARRSL